MKPQILIAAPKSKSSQDLAGDVQQGIKSRLGQNVKVFSAYQEYRNQSESRLDRLKKKLRNSTWGVYVLSGEDIAAITPESGQKSRDETVVTAETATTPKAIETESRNKIRDEVIADLSLFFAILEKQNIFIITPENEDEFPFTEFGIDPETFDLEEYGEDAQVALGTACNQIKGIVERALREQSEKLRAEAAAANPPPDPAPPQEAPPVGNAAPENNHPSEFNERMAGSAVGEPDRPGHNEALPLGSVIAPLTTDEEESATLFFKEMDCLTKPEITLLQKLAAYQLQCCTAMPYKKILEITNQSPDWILAKLVDGGYIRRAAGLTPAFSVTEKGWEVKHRINEALAIADYVKETR